MAQITTGIRSVLSSARVYNLWTKLIGGAASCTDLVQNYVRPKAGDKVLDIGCGTGVLAPFLGKVTYVGFDANPDYIRKAVQHAQEHNLANARFECALVGEDTLTAEPEFDVVLASGILHHLDDDDAAELLCSAKRALRPGGRFVSCDPGIVAGQSPLARWLISKDRGQNVRSARDYAELASAVFPTTVATHVRHDMLRIPYTHVILECVNAQS